MVLKVFCGHVANIFIQKDWAILEIKVSTRRFLDKNGCLRQNQWPETNTWLYVAKFWGFNLFHNREKLEQLKPNDRVMVSYNGINCEQISLKQL